MRIASPLMVVLLAACGGGAVPVQLVSGKLAPGFPGTSLAARAVEGGAVLASMPVDGTGAFVLAVPAGKVKLEIAGSAGHVAFVAAPGASDPAEIQLCHPAGRLDVGVLVYCPSSSACIDATNALNRCQGAFGDPACSLCSAACSKELGDLANCGGGNGLLDCRTATTNYDNCRTQTNCSDQCPCSSEAAEVVQACASACSLSTEALALTTSELPPSVGCGQ